MLAIRREWLILTLCLSGCGYIGEPLYPALNIPSRILDLNVTQRGANLEIWFTEPALTTEGLAIKQIGSLDLRVGPNPSQPFNTQQWADAAARVPVATPDKLGPVHVTVPARQYAGQEVMVGVRAVNMKGRAAEWSNLKALTVQPPLAVPSGVVIAGDPQGVLLRWNGAPEASYRVYRKAGNENLATKLADVTEPRYLDTTTQYGTHYEYWVEALKGEARSEMAGPFTIEPEDKFPPAVPAGVAVTAGLQTIELAWERNTEPDFRGYRVYRATGDGPFEKIAELIEAPGYSDKNVESGKRYRYAISSVDQTGNESEKSAPVGITAP